MIDTLAPDPAMPVASQSSLWSRVRDTFVAPGRLFASFGANPPWVGALAVATVVTALSMAAEPTEFFLAQMEDPVSRRGTPVELTSPPDQIVLWGRVMAIMSALVAHPMLAFAGAGILTLAFRIVRGGDGTFMQYLSVASHALLITSLGMVVTVLLRIVTGDPQILPTPGALAGAAPSSLLGSVLHGVNPFTVWMLVVAAVGVEKLEPRVSRAGAVGILVGAYLVLVVTVGVVFRG